MKKKEHTWLENKEFGTMTGNFSAFNNEVVISPISTTWPSIDPAFNGKFINIMEKIRIKNKKHIILHSGYIALLLKIFKSVKMNTSYKGWNKDFGSVKKLEEYNQLKLICELQLTKIIYCSMAGQFKLNNNPFYFRRGLRMYS